MSSAKSGYSPATRSARARGVDGEGEQFAEHLGLLGNRRALTSTPASVMQAARRSLVSSRSATVKSGRYPRRSACRRRIRSPTEWNVLPQSRDRSPPMRAVMDPLHHFAGRLVGEGEEEDAFRRDPVFEQPGDAVGEGARLARAGPGEHEAGSRTRGDRRQLLFVQLAGVVDPQVGGRLEGPKLVLTRHSRRVNRKSRM